MKWRIGTFLFLDILIFYDITDNYDIAFKVFLARILSIYLSIHSIVRVFYLKYGLKISNIKIFLHFSLQRSGVHLTKKKKRKVECIFHFFCLLPSLISVGIPFFILFSQLIHFFIILDIYFLNLVIKNT